jgi:hypothetical protein
MALVKGTNAYATVEEAETYFLDQLDRDAWESATDTQKAQALVTATSMLDNLNWTGVAVSESQLLAFPRSGYYFDPRLGSEQALSGTPVRITKATYELAYHLLNNDGLLDDTGEVSNLEFGPIKLERIRSSSRLPGTVNRLIKPLLENAGSNLWWRAN